MFSRLFLTFGISLSLLLCRFAAAGDQPITGPHKYQDQAKEVMQYIQQNLYDRSTGLYFHSAKDRHADFMWSNGVLFSALAGASRYEPDIYLPVMSRFFKATDAYWDYKAPIPGYEPAPTSGNGNDKYYDDNEWMVITFVEAYELTHNPQYLQRAQETLKFCLSGWDDKLGGGIWWHERHKGGGKNTCSNGPAAVACLRLAKYLAPAQARSSVAMAGKIVDWTVGHLQSDDGLYADNENVTTEKKSNAKLTYNTALMIRAQLGLFRWTGDAKYLQQAKRSAQAGDWFLSRKTNAYRDAMKWSHLMVEADLEMYRVTHEQYLLTRARNNADHAYTAWKASPEGEAIDTASVARLLWLMADNESETGRQFWARADRVSK